MDWSYDIHIFITCIYSSFYSTVFIIYIYTLCCVYILEAYFLSWEMWWNIAAKAHGILAFNSRALKEYTWSTVQPGWGEASKGHEKPRFLEVVNRFTRSVRLDFLRWFIENLWISICIEDSKGNHFTISKNGGERTFHVHPPRPKPPPFNTGPICRCQHWECPGTPRIDQNVWRCHLKPMVLRLEDWVMATQIFFIFTPILGEDEPILTSIFFKWVGSTTN